jgi:hypothetical protein
MSESERLTDEQMLAELRDALAAAPPGEHDPDRPPPWVFEGAKALFGLRTLEAELAELTWDSFIDDAVGAIAVRAVDDLRVLEFESSGTTVELEVEPAGPWHCVHGQVTPGHEMDVRIRVLPDSSDPVAPSPGPAGADMGTRQVVREVRTDAHGRFTVPDLPRGMTSLVCTGARGSHVVTGWIHLP